MIGPSSAKHRPLSGTEGIFPQSLEEHEKATFYRLFFVNAHPTLWCEKGYGEKENLLPFDRRFSKKLPTAGDIINLFYSILRTMVVYMCVLCFKNETQAAQGAVRLEGDVITANGSLMSGRPIGETSSLAETGSVCSCTCTWLPKYSPMLTLQPLPPPTPPAIATFHRSSIWPSLQYHSQTHYTACQQYWHPDHPQSSTTPSSSTKHHINLSINVNLPFQIITLLYLMISFNILKLSYKVPTSLTLYYFIMSTILH